MHSLVSHSHIHKKYPWGECNIKIVWHSCSPWAQSGYGCQTAIWIQELAKAGHDVTVSSYWGLSGAPTSWNDITILPGFGANYCTPSLAEHVKRIRPDLVITLGDIWVMDPNLLRPLPLAHWLPSDCRPMSQADRACMESSGAQVIAMSRFGEENFRRAGFRPLYVPHGIDTSLFSPATDADAREKVRKDMGLDGKFVIGINAANNDAIRKAIPEMMLAYAKFSAQHDDILLALHTGVHQDGGQDLEAIAANLGITDQVRVADQYRYNGGLISSEEMCRWYQAIDVLAECTYGEGFGLPILEAQSCGTPVITTFASSMPELNLLGMNVEGEPFWNGVHKAWWIRPSVSAIYAALEDAYDKREEVDHDKLREFALEYDKDNVATQYMLPAVLELAERVKGKTV